jgi:hypothetical protein
MMRAAVLGECCLGRAGAREKLELGALDMPVETAVFGKAMEEPRHPPGEPLSLPDTGERAVGIAVEAGRRLGGVKFGKRLPQVINLAGGEVEALGAGRRHDMGGSC